MGKELSSPLAFHQIHHHLEATFSDTSRGQDLGPCKALVTPPEPVFQFNSAEPILVEVKETVEAAVSSLSGHSSIAYKVCKQSHNF